LTARVLWVRRGRKPHLSTPRGNGRGGKSRVIQRRAVLGLKVFQFLTQVGMYLRKSGKKAKKQKKGGG